MRARYWHGIVAVLKPLLLFGGYTDIRAICIFLFMGLFAATLIGVYRRLGWLYALAFFIAMFAIYYFTLPATITMVFPWLITFIVSLVILCKKRFTLFGLSMLFFVAGCWVNFFEYMLTVIYALGLPLALLFAILGQESRRRFSQDVQLLIVPSAAYFTAFGLSWIFKWGLASAVTNENVFAAALGAIFLRSGGTEGGRMSAIWHNLAMLWTQPVGRLILLFMLVFFILLLFFFHKKLAAEWNSAYLLAPLALLPCGWYFFTAQHAAIHVNMTYRYLVITLLSGQFLLCHFIDSEAVSRWVGKKVVKQ